MIQGESALHYVGTGYYWQDVEYRPGGSVTESHFKGPPNAKVWGKGQVFFSLETLISGV